jgi:transposase
MKIHVDFKKGSRFSCSKCGENELPVYDTAEKTWRHLNFWQYKTFVHMRTPRTICPKCGKHLWIPPWNGQNSGFTLLFEAFVIRLAREMPVSQIAEIVGETDTRLSRLIHVYVKSAYREKHLLALLISE